MARAAGVSVATVSRALRGLDGVSGPTRDRVRRAAAELDYVASPTARSLASGRTRTVGVAVPLLTRWLPAALVSALARAVRGMGYQPLLLDLDDGPGARLTLSRDLLWKRVDGLIAVHVPLTGREIDLLHRLGLPVITIGSPVADWPAVGIDAAAAASTAVEHLLRLGHTEVAHLDSPALGPASAGSIAPGSTEHHRSTVGPGGEGFAAGLRRHGLAPSRVVSCGPTTAEAAQASRPLLSGRRPPTAVVAGSDELAIGVLAAARRRGLRVPADVSVIGTDDHPFAEALGLTTIRQDVEAQARIAAALLVHAVADIDTAATDTDADGHRSAGRVVVPAALVVRESTGPAPAAG